MKLVTVSAAMSRALAFMTTLLVTFVRTISGGQDTAWAVQLGAGAGRLAARMCAVAVIVATSSVAMAANFPLELVSPRAAGTVPSTDANTPAIPATHRIFKAYPGIEYNIRAVVIGGAYPYSFGLSNAPSGMTIDADTGVISWPNPQASATPTMTVTDAEGTSRSAAWTINVTTTGFYFVDRINGSPNNPGTRDAPWQDLLQIWRVNDNDGIVYFRNGVYSNAGIPRDSVGSTWERVQLPAAAPRIWVAYPGEHPVIDNGGSEQNGVTGAFIRVGSDTVPTYFDGLEITNHRNILLQSGHSDYETYRRMKIHNIWGGQNGANSSGIMWLSAYSSPSHYASIQDSEFYDLTGPAPEPAAGGYKAYSIWKFLVEDNIFRNYRNGPDLKSQTGRFEVRRNQIYNQIGTNPKGGIAGDMDSDGVPATGEIRFNYVNTPGTWAVEVNRRDNNGAVYVYRNTLVGIARMANVTAATGPFRWYNNVIINDNSNNPDRIDIVNLEAPERITISDNLSGSPGSGILDASGRLQGDFRRYMGTHGWEIADAGPLPTPPSNLRVE